MGWLEAVTLASALRAAVGTANLMHLAKTLRKSPWPVVTASHETALPPYKSFHCMELAGQCRAVTIYEPDHEEDEVIYLFNGAIFFPRYTGDKETIRGGPALSRVMFNYPHNPQILSGFHIPLPYDEKLCRTPKELQQVLDSWNIPASAVPFTEPRRVRETLSHKPVYCIHGVNYSGVSTCKQTLIDNTLTNSRGFLYYTSLVTSGLGSILWLFVC